MKRIALVEGPTYVSNLIAAAVELGYTVVLIRGLSGSLYRDLQLSDKALAQVEFVTECDLSSDQALIQCIQQFAENFPIQGLLGIHELVLERVARVAKRYDFPFSKLSALELARDKHQMRRKLFELGLTTYDSVPVQDESSLGAAFERIGWPCVLKPRRGTGSFSVFVMPEPLDSKEVWRKATESTASWPTEIHTIASADFVLEKYFEGPLLSLEVSVAEGKPQLLATSWRFRAIHDETIEIGTLMPAPHSEAVKLEIAKFVANIIMVSGLDRGICHIEAIYTENGPELVELNPRLMGGSLPLLFNRSFNVNIFKSLIPTYLDNLPTSKSSEPPAHSLSCFFGALNAGKMPAHTKPGFLSRYTSYRPELKFLVEPGQEIQKVQSNYSYLGRFILTAPTIDELFQVRDEILDFIEDDLGIVITRPEKGTGI